MRRLILWLAVGACLLSVGGNCASAEDFRIETQIFAEGEEKPASQNLTLFAGGIVYDFLSEPVQISVFKKSADAQEGRFILLDPTRRLRAELTTAHITQFTTNLKNRAIAQPDPFLQFALDPKFETTFDAQAGELKMASDLMTYRVLTMPAKNAETARQYRDFTDWYARAGAILHLGSTPPFPRLAVNAELMSRQVVPREVNVTVTPAKRQHPRVMRSEHQVTWRLSSEDRKRIDDVGKYMVDFKLVPLSELVGQ